MRSIARIGLALVFAAAASQASADWSPQAYGEEDTLEFLTTEPEDGEHWSTVWLVVIDGDVYVRLGSRAAARIEANTRAPIVSVRIAGDEFSAIEAVAAPEMAEPVAQAMREKYWTDVFVRGLEHPLTMKLRPATPPVDGSHSP